MSAPFTAIDPEENRPRDRSIWLAIPSWILSLALHAGLLALFALTFQRPATIGDPQSGDREVGIYYKPAHDALPDVPGETAGEAPAPAATATPSGASVPDADLAVEEAPPVALDLPSAAAPRIGPGLAVPADGAASDARQMIRSNGSARAAGEPGASGGGGTTFFGQKATGARFVYVLDASGSMHEHNALGVAKAELLASLAQLDSNQQFEIIFYSEKCYPMVGPGGKPQMFWGTDVNRTKASQFVRGVSPLEGTRHLEALLTALSYNPDVIFFLTDAGEPRLDPADLAKIKRRNGGRTQIHAIEFGKGANIDVESNFLKRLARENGGGYVYRDIQRFQRE